MSTSSSRISWPRWVLLAAFAITAAAYWPGLSGGFLFDDYPNIVDNHGVQPHDASISSLTNAALSSPASEFKRPLASLSFAANYLVSGLDPYWMKLTNLFIHLLNGLLVFWLARALLRWAASEQSTHLPAAYPVTCRMPALAGSADTDRGKTSAEPTGKHDAHTSLVAALICASWMVLPINLTGVLYVVQRMESMANAFVLLGLIGYVAGRRRMLAPSCTVERTAGSLRQSQLPASYGLALCIVSVSVPAAIGLLAKETAVMLPLYALLTEWALFGFRHPVSPVPALTSDKRTSDRDRRIVGLFIMVLVLPAVLGLAWLLPSVLKPETWAGRDFTLETRLLSEARIIVDYVVWTLLPTPDALSFYHDNFRVSISLLSPWTTLASIILLGVATALLPWLRRRQPLVALGLALFLGCQLLTGTILPLELIYEHRNYFASFGLLLACVPLLAVPRSLPFALPRHVLLAGLLTCWIALTTITAYAWGNPLRLAEDLASRDPQSPRAQYELGRTYIIYSHYDPASPFTALAYAPLEKSAALPDSSILPEQALIFMNARMRLPLKDAWWISMIGKLKAHKPGVQDESSLAALTQCAREHHCDLPKKPMTEAFLAALAHPDPSARLLAIYGDYSWNVLGDHDLGVRIIEAAVKAAPGEPAYQITLVRMLAAQDRIADAEAALKNLETLNIGGRLNDSLGELRAAISALHSHAGSSTIR